LCEVRNAVAATFLTSRFYCITVNVAVLLVFPIPASLEDIALVVLLFSPADEAVTFTLNAQEPFPARVAPARVTNDELTAAVTVPPPQDPTRPFGVPTERPAGREFAKEMPLSVLPGFGLMIEKVRDTEPFMGTLPVPNVVTMIGAPAGPASVAGAFLTAGAAAFVPAVDGEVAGATPPFFVDQSFSIAPQASLTAFFKERVELANNMVPSCVETTALRPLRPAPEPSSVTPTM